MAAVKPASFRTRAHWRQSNAVGAKSMGLSVPSPHSRSVKVFTVKWRNAVLPRRYHSICRSWGGGFPRTQAVAGKAVIRVLLSFLLHAFAHFYLAGILIRSHMLDTLKELNKVGNILKTAITAHILHRIAISQHETGLGHPHRI